MPALKARFIAVQFARASRNGGLQIAAQPKRRFGNRRFQCPNSGPKPAPQSVALPMKFSGGRIGRARLRRAAKPAIPRNLFSAKIYEVQTTNGHECTRTRRTVALPIERKQKATKKTKDSAARAWTILEGGLRRGACGAERALRRRARPSNSKRIHNLRFSLFLSEPWALQAGGLLLKSNSCSFVVKSRLRLAAPRHPRSPCVATRSLRKQPRGWKV